MCLYRNCRIYFTPALFFFLDVLKWTIKYDSFRISNIQIQSQLNELLNYLLTYLLSGRILLTMRKILRCFFFLRLLFFLSSYYISIACIERNIWMFSLLMLFNFIQSLFHFDFQWDRISVCLSTKMRAIKLMY